MWETIGALIAKLDAGHIVVLLILGGREYIAWQERKMLGSALEKIVDSLNAVKVAIAAITGKAA